MYTEIQHAVVAVVAASVEDTIATENIKLKQDLAINTREIDSLKGQLDNFERKFREFRIFHENVKRKGASKLTHEKTATIKTLQEQLENKQHDYQEVLDEIEIAGYDAKTAQEEVTRLLTDIQDLEQRLEEEEETNRQMQRQLETANREGVVLSEQRERDVKRIEELERELEAVKREVKKDRKDRRAREATGAKVSIRLYATEESSSNMRRSKAQSREGNVQGGTGGHTRGERNVTSEDSRESGMLQLHSSENSEILWGLLDRNIADFEAEEVANSATGKL
ncbi:hypothetical protein ONS95_003442 [Cadophora gregata]|uniref:uncharacterized protein n=1 Tax=Cadophora gregata TaxID=51156 RepID=UPI0026DC1DD0|nr:uncharacterized protein ONS95_003442 [Cadophora gregata]KAK0108649.1 hypothetical protein ONS95_003442 [Cadophora gregata]KAK0108760.1 hypothetical protein ONS96_002605 [Cadophora gregata f. sp. sojae]